MSHTLGAYRDALRRGTKVSPLHYHFSLSSLEAEGSQWGWLKNGQIQFVELGEWSNLQGLSLIQAIPDVERLRSFLGENPTDVPSICAKAGYILEAALNS